LEQDDIASWMEHYHKVMDLNIELGVTVGKIDYDDLSRQYTVPIKSQDGGERVVTPHHLVLATGLFSSTPARPEFENESFFTGQIYHSASHQSASLIPDLGEKKVVLIGAGTSAHDIAQDFASCGAKEVTMIQRSPMFVLSTNALDKFVLAPWKLMPMEDADLVSTSLPFPIALTLMLGATYMMAQHDTELLSAVEKAGLAVKRGEDGIGLLHYQLIKAGHFYIDQGACEMIADGRIKIQRSQEGAEGFDHNAVILGDGTRIEADIVVVATGFKRCSDVAESIMGKEFMAKVGQVGELDVEGERIGVSFKLLWCLGFVLTNFRLQLWRPAAVPGFWYMTGSFLWSRTYSKPLALQIKAIEEGLNREHYSSSK
jgi:cation diffusion facilitator CzcD-associated flavoprotein CzcO